MPQLFSPTLEDQIAEIEEELRMRAYVYPKRVALGRMTQERAERKTEVMLAVLVTLRERREERDG